MIAIYIDHGYGEDVLQCFEQIKWVGMKPYNFTLASVVGTCSCLDAFK